MVVKNKDTEKPSYESVTTVDLQDHISIIENDRISIRGETATLETVLPPVLDRTWPADIPPWRIVVLPLASQPGSTVKRCLIAFAFSHTLGDGMVGLAFHRTFLEAWQQQTTVTDENESFCVTPSVQSIPEPFDAPERLTISWGFLLGPLLAVLLPKFLAGFLGLRAATSTVDAGTWTGSPIFFDPAATQNSRVRLLDIEAPLVQQALQASRNHDAKLTATMHQFIVRALSKAIPGKDITNFVSGTAIDMRGSIGIPAYTWGLFVSGHYEVHPRIDDTPAQSTLTDEMWAAASSMTKSLAECGTRLHNQAIGLLRYAPSIRKWALGKIGSQRDSSYEVSNLLAFDGDAGDANLCKISKMIFVQPGNALSAPLVFNIISVKGGSLMCAISWQVGALGVPVEQEEGIVDEIRSSLLANFEALQA